MTIIAYNPELAKEVGPIGALFVQQLSYWQARTTGHDDDTKEWVWKSLADWSQELGVGVKAIRNAITKLVDLGVVVRDKLKAKQWWQVWWYKLDKERLKTLFPSICPPGQMERSKKADRSAPKGKSSIDPEITNKDLSQNSQRESVETGKQPEQPAIEKEFVDWVIKTKLSRLPNQPVCPDLAAYALIKRSPGLRAEWDRSKPPSKPDADAKWAAIYAKYGRPSL